MHTLKLSGDLSKEDKLCDIVTKLRIQGKIFFGCYHLKVMFDWW